MKNSTHGVRWPLWLATGFVAVTVAYPLAILLVQTVFPEVLAGSFTNAGKAFAELTRTPGIGEMLLNSLRWGTATTCGAWLFGIPCGILLARAEFRGKRLLRVGLLLPLMTPPYLLALAYILLMQPGGLADQWTGGLHEGIRRTFFGFWGVTFVMVAASFGSVALTLEAALRSIPGKLEDAAEGLGAKRYQLWMHILLPLLLPAVLNSGVLVFVEALSNFGVPAVLGTRANLPLLPAEIYSLVTNWPVNIPLATVLSLLLCVVAAVLFQTSRWLLRRHGMDTSRGGLPKVIRPGRFGTAMIWTWFASLVFVSAILPIGVIVLASFVGRWNDGTPEWTLAHFKAVFQTGAGGLEALGTSAWLSGATATTCVVVGALAAYAIRRNPGWLSRMTDYLSLLPRIVPRIVVAVAMILAWNAPWVVLPIYNTLWLLLLAYFALYQSDAVRLADTGMRSVGVNLEHAALVLGASRWRTLREVVFPLLRPALLIAWITTFVVCMRDLVASILLLPPGTQTVGSYIFTQFEQGDMGRAMAMATCTLLLSSAVLLVVQRPRAKKNR